MRNLHYATVANETHSITVATWTEPGGDDGDMIGFKMMVDGRVLEEGLL